MSRKIVSVVAVCAAVASSATAAFLYFHPVDRAANASASASTSQPADEDMSGRQIAARKLQFAAQDKWLTGDRDGHAEWRPPTDGFYTTCGITPHGRYLIAKNEIGKARYNEPWSGDGGSFDTAWSKAQCDATSPKRQVGILQRVEQARQAKFEDDLYNDSHPINSECLIAEMRANAGSGAYHLDKNKHYCQDGSYLRNKRSDDGADNQP